MAAVVGPKRHTVNGLRANPNPNPNHSHNHNSVHINSHQSSSNVNNCFSNTTSSAQQFGHRAAVPVVAPTSRSRPRISMSVSMSLVQGGAAGGAPQGAILAAAAPYYQPPAVPQDVQPDRPIGYGAFGVVWAVTDPRDGRRVALKKLPNVFQSLVSSKRVFRELKMLCFFKHENVLSALDILQPPHLDFFQEIYVITELLQSDLHKIIVSPQHLSADHIKVFLYQILRGLKYLHSARILHRDIKPGNLLVNSNCVLKICDFGLARVEEPDQAKHMTQEVVTQYYRAPEILMGARHYSSAVDVWSVGCIFGELLGRRILFQAQNPVQQLELITELLGTPSMEDMRHACDGARSHMLRRAPKLPSFSALYTLSSHATHEAVHLLCQMLVFDPDKRITVTDALAHPYLDEGRLRYHSCMCKCCFTTSAGMRQYTADFEPSAGQPFDDLWERKLTSVQQVKEEMHKFIAEQLQTGRVPLCINPQSAAFKSFARYVEQIRKLRKERNKRDPVGITLMQQLEFDRRKEQQRLELEAAFKAMIMQTPEVTVEPSSAPNTGTPSFFNLPSFSSFDYTTPHTNKDRRSLSVTPLSSLNMTLCWDEQDDSETDTADESMDSGY
ncbi:serine/threonine-protein kinase NLK2 isoform X1 [Zeugodacus cucurbitae]|uniref:serine/threonine-protein kinase NLK2 isoform X1 n=1 Tax=Zeugodacus cucurbitae TaxID=28588 RepID=UPI000596959A|nr:serine/threonine-protein kinase NLK2 isoform X1 [Zeugodacus cucurbitae]XP_054085368.1 serine/threonine-protein kinase NLK2 isoform X1 [Zeugodacus cucurbitae]